VPDRSFLERQAFLCPGVRASPRAVPTGTLRGRGDGRFASVSLVGQAFLCPGVRASPRAVPTGTLRGRGDGRFAPVFRTFAGVVTRFSEERCDTNRPASPAGPFVAGLTVTRPRNQASGAEAPRPPGLAVGVLSPAAARRPGPASLGPVRRRVGRQNPNHRVGRAALTLFGSAGSTEARPRPTRWPAAATAAAERRRVRQPSAPRASARPRLRRRAFACPLRRRCPSARASLAAGRCGGGCPAFVTRRGVRAAASPPLLHAKAGQAPPQPAGPAAAKSRRPPERPAGQEQEKQRRLTPPLLYQSSRSLGGSTVLSSSRSAACGPVVGCPPACRVCRSALGSCGGSGGGGGGSGCVG